MFSTVVDLLSSVNGLPKDWVEHGRLCSPRLLFLFEVDTLIPSRVTQLKTIEVNQRLEQKNVLQDDIFIILRKCRVITNIRFVSHFGTFSEFFYPSTHI